MTDPALDFRNILLEFKLQPTAERLAEAIRLALPLRRKTERLRDVRRVARAPTITFHEFLQGVRRVFGTHWPLLDPAGLPSCPIDEIQNGWDQLVLAALVCGPATVACLADGWLEATVGLFDPGPEQFASRRRYGINVPAQRLRHLLASPLVLPEDTAQLLGANGLARLAEIIAWEPATVALPRTLPGMAAVLLTAVPADAPADRADELLGRLLAANDIPAPPRFGPFFVDMAQAGPDRTVRFAEWLHLRLPRQAECEASADDEDARELALCRLLSQAEAVALGH